MAKGVFRQYSFYIPLSRKGLRRAPVAGEVTATGTITFIGTAIASGATRAFATITIIGDVAASGTGFVYPTATSTFIGDVSANGKNLTAATIGYIGTLIAGGGQHSATATTTTIGNLAAIGTDISSGTVNAIGTITFLSQVAASGTQLASGTSVFIGELAANGGIALSLATGTIFIGSQAGDPLWSQTQFLADFEGADAATAYTERSDNAAVATFNNNAQLDTAEFNSGGSSLLLDGTGDDVSFPDIADYDLAPSGAQNWTIECFVRFDSLLSNPEQRELMGQYGAGGNAWSMGFQADGFSTQRIRVRPDLLDEVATISGFTVATDTWYHYVMQRQGDDLYVGMNGRRIFQSTGTFSGAQVTSTEPLRIGSNFGVSADMWNGSVDDVRITIGANRYDLSPTTYTVPTTPFPIGGSTGPALSAVGTAITPATATVAVIGTLGAGGGTQFATATIIIIGDQAGGGGTQYAQGTITTIGDLVAAGTVLSPGSLVFAAGSINFIGSIDAKGRSFCPIKAYGTISIIGSLSAVELYDTLIVKARASINIGAPTSSYWLEVVNDPFDSGMKEDLWINGPAMEDRHYMWFPPLPDNGDGTLGLQGWTSYSGSMTPPEDDRYWWDSDWPAAITRRRYFADQAVEIDYGGWNRNNGQLHHVSVSLRSDILDEMDDSGEYDPNDIETNLWITLDYDGGIYTGVGNSEVRVFMMNGYTGFYYIALSPRIIIGAIPDSGTFRAEVVGRDVRILINGSIVYNFRLPVTGDWLIRGGIRQVNENRDPKFYGHVVLWSFLYWDNSNQITGLNDNPLFVPADQAFDDFNYDFFPEFLYRPPRQTPFETHYIDAARVYEWVYISGDLAARGTIVTTSGRFNAYGSINIEGHLSQATLNKETCITPTATLTVPAAVMSASGTDLNLKRSFATITVTATLGVSAIYVRASSLAVVGELTALGRNLPIGDLMMQSRLADFSLAGMAGPGTINGQKVFLINIPYDAATIYNNSLGGFFTISGGSTLKEARSLINWRVLMTALGSTDQTKFAIGTVNMIGAVTAKGMHKPTATIVYVPVLAATGGRTPTGTITFFSQLYAQGPQDFAPTYNGSQSPSVVVNTDSNYHANENFSSSAFAKSSIYVDASAGDTAIRVLADGGGGGSQVSLTESPGAGAETTIFNLNVRADTVKIRLVSSVNSDTNPGTYPSTVPKIGSFTDNVAFNPTNGVDYGYRGDSSVAASDPPYEENLGSILPIVEFTFVKAGYNDLVVTYKALTTAYADAGLPP